MCAFNDGALAWAVDDQLLDGTRNVQVTAVAAGYIGAAMDSIDVTDFVGYMTGGGGRIMLPGRSAINPFANVETSSDAALQGGIDKIGGATGANTKGLLDAIKIRNIIKKN